MGISRFKRHEIGRELSREGSNNYAIVFDGDNKFWKVFKSKKKAERMIGALALKGKKAHIVLTARPANESLEEKVEVNHSRYLRSHGKKATGKGYWMFTNEPYKTDFDNVFGFNGSFSAAASAAKKHFKNSEIIFVMEGVAQENFKLNDPVVYKDKKGKELFGVIKGFEKVEGEDGVVIKWKNGSHGRFKISRISTTSGKTPTITERNIKEDRLYEMIEISLGKENVNEDVFQSLKDKIDFNSSILEIQNKYEKL